MEYILTTESIERQLGLCGHIIGVSIRYTDGIKEIILTTDKDVPTRK